MFRKTDPQRNLFGVETSMPSGLQSRLKGSWAGIFRTEVLAILLRSEEDFAKLYGITGRPNFSVARILGLCFLQELNDLSDQDALDAFGFDARWQYALDVTGEEAYLSRRSLVEFRSRMVRVDPEMALMRSVFNRISQGAIDKLGISVSEQRLDSTHVHSNIHARGRLALFVDVLQVFLKSLDEKDYSRVPLHIRKWHEQESNGWFGMGNAAERKAKVGQLAGYIHRLLECFREIKAVMKGEAYQLLARLFQEQCEVVKRGASEPSDDGTDPDEDKQEVFLSTPDTPPSTSSDDDDGTDSDEDKQDASTSAPEASPSTSSDDDGTDPDEDKQDASTSAPEAPPSESDALEQQGVDVKVKRSPKGGDTLQSAYDPDASYGHKGRGFSVHITETCNNPDTSEIITDYEVHGAARSDVGKTTDALDRLEKVGLLPERLFSDGGYPTVEDAYDIIVRRGIDLMAPVHRGPMDESVMGRDRFEFDDAGHVMRCPEGHPAIDHKIMSNNSTKKTLHAIFDGDTCRQCDKLETCPVRAPNHREKGQSPRDTTGNFRLEITPELRLRDDMLRKQQTKEWKDDYKIRSGVEATMSELKRGYGIGKLRVRGLARVHFAVVCKVTACNIKRWWRAALAAGCGATPLSTAASSPFATAWHRLRGILRGIRSREVHIPEFTCNTLYLAA